MKEKQNIYFYEKRKRNKNIQDNKLLILLAFNSSSIQNVREVKIRSMNAMIIIKKNNFHFIFW